MKQQMTQTEHLCLIRSRCVELLGIWDNKRDHNLTYSATCGQEAEAGWRVTIAAVDTALASIDDIQGEMPYNIKMCEQLISA